MSTQRLDAMSAARSSLHELGFAVFEGLLEPRRDELMDLARRLIDAGSAPGGCGNEAGHWNEGGFLFEGTGSGRRRLYKVQGVCVDPRFGSEALEKVFRDERIVNAVRDLFESSAVDSSTARIDVFGTKFFPVWQGDGRSVGWHQDSHYFGSHNCDGRILSFAIYLEETDRENGCLQVVPGSHRLKTNEYPHRPGAGAWAQGEWIDDGLVRGEIAKCAGGSDGNILDVEVPACSVVVFDARLVHGARENRSATRTRFSFFGHFCQGDMNFEWRGVDFSRGKYADRHCIVD